VLYPHAEVKPNKIDNKYEVNDGKEMVCNKADIDNSFNVKDIAMGAYTQEMLDRDFKMEMKQEPDDEDMEGMDDNFTSEQSNDAILAAKIKQEILENFEGRKSIGNIGQDGRHYCIVCAASYKTRDNLYRHFKNIHMGAKGKEWDRVPCPNCSQFIVKKCLKKHIENKHLNPLKNKDICCDLCEYKSYRLSDMKRHKEHVHSEDRKYVCEKCSQKFKWKGDLKVHMDSHIYRDCTVCGYFAPKRTGLIVHLKKMHPEVDLETYFPEGATEIFW